jgi:small subunit ribosomal protein S18
MPDKNIKARRSFKKVTLQKASASEIASSLGITPREAKRAEAAVKFVMRTSGKPDSSSRSKSRDSGVPSSSSGRSGAQGGKKKFFYRRKRVCKFCIEEIEYIDYKDIKSLQQFIPECGKILPRRVSGTCALHQRKLQKAIKRAGIDASKIV